MTEPTVATQTSFRAGRALGWLAGFGAFGVGVSALYATTGRGVGCLFHAVTGWQCPLCGGTRLGSALLHGDVSGAMAANPLVFLGLVLLAGLGALWIIEVAGGPRVRLPASVSTRIRRVRPTRWLLVSAAAATAYVLLRNLL